MHGNRKHTTCNNFKYLATHFGGFLASPAAVFSIKSLRLAHTFRPKQNPARSHSFGNRIAHRNSYHLHICTLDISQSRTILIFYRNLGRVLDPKFLSFLNLSGSNFQTTLINCHASIRNVYEALYGGTAK